MGKSKAKTKKKAKTRNPHTGAMVAIGRPTGLVLRTRDGVRHRLVIKGPGVVWALRRVGVRLSRPGGWEELRLLAPFMVEAITFIHAVERRELVHDFPRGTRCVATADPRVLILPAARAALYFAR